MLTDPKILEGNGLKHVYDPGAGAAWFGFDGVVDEQIISPLYGISLPMWTLLTNSSDRGVVVIRDLRDQIVSGIFSTAYLHAPSRNLELHRSFLLALPRTQWIEFGMLLAAREAPAIESWFEGAAENILLVRYEELVAETESTLARIFASLRIEAPWRMSEELPRLTRFQNSQAVSPARRMC
jgi:hypothetical protein